MDLSIIALDLSIIVSDLTIIVAVLTLQTASRPFTRHLHTFYPAPLFIPAGPFSPKVCLYRERFLVKIKKDSLWRENLSLIAILRASCRIRTNDPEITNHVLWPTELKRRVGSCLYRAATTKYPCYVPILGDSEGAGRTGLPVFSQKAGDKISASQMQRARSMLRRSLISQTICKNRLQR